MAGYIGGKAVNLSTSGADISGTANLDIVDIDGAVDMATTALVTGVLTANGGAVFNEGSADVDFRVESNGNANMLFVDGGNDAVVIGHDNANDGSVSSAFSLQNIGTSYNSSSIGLARFSADVNAPAVAFHKSRNASIGGDTVVADNDELGRIRFFGNDGTDFAEGARITALVNGTPGGGDMPTELVFSTSADGAESPTARMTIANAGNVGIGTSSPSTKLSVLANSANGIELAQDPDGGTNSGRLFFTTSGGSNSIRSTSGALQFSTGATAGSSSGTERMRIDSSGNVLVGTASLIDTGVENSIQVLGSTSAALWTMVTKSHSRGRVHYHTSSSGISDFFITGSTAVGSISQNASSTTYATSSDYRLKTDAQPMTNATARVLALNPVNFEWIVDGTRVDGFLAHEAQEVVPEAVTGTKDAMRDEEYEVTPAVLDDDGNETTAAVMGTRSVPDMQGIDQSKMVPLLVAALQEALARITALENA